MRLKTFTAASMSEAMNLVRDDMGEDAIIVSTQKGADGSACRVTAAIEEELLNEALIPVGRDDDLDTFSVDAYLRQMLTAHGLPPHVLESLLRAAEDIKEQDPALALAAAIDARMKFLPIDMEQQTRPIVLVGPPGAGKTITAAKIAAHAKFEGKSVAIATTDAKRAGGVEQLEAFTRILGVELLSVADAQALEQAASTVATADVAVIDTAGVNPFDDSEMLALRDIADAVGGEPLLVMPAGGDAMESADTAAAFRNIGVGRMIITRLDMTRRLGGILAAALSGRLAIANVSINPQVADGLNRLNPVSLARLVVPEDEPDGTLTMTKAAL